MFRRKNKRGKDDSGGDETFMGYVQIHERAWGTDDYKGRPKLTEILAAPIVAFWYSTQQGEARLLVSLYDHIDELEEEISTLFLHSRTRPIERRLFRLFYQQKRLHVEGLQLILTRDRPN